MSFFSVRALSGFQGVNYVTNCKIYQPTFGLDNCARLIGKAQQDANILEYLKSTARLRQKHLFLLARKQIHVEMQ